MLRALAYLACCLFAGPLLAQDARVELKTPDGNILVSGDLIGQTGEFFRIQTDQGPVTVDAGALLCSGAGCPPAEDMIVRSTIAGPPDLLTEFLAPLMAGFATHRGLTFTETFLSDDRLVWSLRDPATDRETARFDVGSSNSSDLLISRIADEPEFAADILALDALVAVVAPDNPVATLSTPTLRLLLEGRVEAWPELLTGRIGADPEPVTLHLPTDLSALGRIWPFSPIAPARSARKYRSPDALAEAVAADPGALGIVPLSRIGNTTPLVLAGPCGRVLTATPSRIKAEDYPLTKPVYIQRLNPIQPRLVRDFIAYAQSPAAQSVIRRTGLVDQSIGRIAFADQGDRLAAAILAAEEDATQQAEVRRMIRALAAGERLTLTFRFEDGDATLDAPSRSNIRQLADAVLNGDFADRELLFAGFTDSQGPAEPNLRLSRQRARTVADAITQLIGDVAQPMIIDGFGEILPMACDSTHWGREINRRVEVWARAKRPTGN